MERQQKELLDFFEECIEALKDALFGWDSERERKATAIRELIAEDAARYPREE